LNPNSSENMVTAVAAVKGEGAWIVQFFSHNFLQLTTLPDVFDGMLVFSADVQDPAVRAEIAASDTRIGLIGGVTASSIITNYYTASDFDAVDMLTRLILLYKGDASKVAQALGSRTFHGRIDTTVHGVGSGKIYFGNNTFVQGVSIAVSKFIFSSKEWVIQ